MPNSKPIASDLDVLQGFKEPFVVDNLPRDERMAKLWGCSLKQVYALWEKPRFAHLIEYGVSLRSGWLTEKGIQKLKKLENE